MRGFENKRIVIRLVKRRLIFPGKAKKYFIIITRKRSRSTSRHDCVGTYTSHIDGYTHVRYFHKKLIKYLVYKHVTIEPIALRCFNIEPHFLVHKKELKKPTYLRYTV